jgi:hypothetical protein
MSRASDCTNRLVISAVDATAISMCFVMGNCSGAAMRRFPPPWTVEALDGGGFKIVDANKQGLAYVYARGNRADADNAKVLTTDEARRIAANIAKLPKLLAK